MTKDDEILASKVMKYWGADDCRFSRKEIALIVGIPKNEVDRLIKLVETERPEFYAPKSVNREKHHKQQIFEENMDKVDTSIMDASLGTDRMDHETPMSTNNKSLRIREHMHKNRDSFGEINED